MARWLIASDANLFPHMAGTASSLAGTLRFGIGALVGFLLSVVPISSAWPMVGSMAFCILTAVLLCLYASRARKPEI